MHEPVDDLYLQVILDCAHEQNLGNNTVSEASN